MYLALSHGTPLDIRAMNESADPRTLWGWYDDIVSVVGDVGSHALEEVKNRLTALYAPDAWNALSEQQRQTAILEVLRDYNARRPWLPWAIAGGALFLWLWRR